MAELANSWISAFDAEQQLARGIGGQQQAQAAIHAAISTGTMEGRANLMLLENDIGPLGIDEIGWDREIHPHNGQEERSFCKRSKGETSSLLVSSNFLSRDVGWIIDELQTDWGSGTFVARRVVPVRQPPKLQPRTRVVVNVPRRYAQLEISSPSNDRLEVTLRRAVSGMMFRRIDIDQIGRTNSVPMMEIARVATDRDEYYEADNLRPRTDEVDEQFRMEIKTGEFAKHGVPGSPGYRPRLIAEYDRRVKKLYDELDAPPRLPSRPTIGRRVDRLLDEFREYQKKMTRVDPT